MPRNPDKNKLTTTLFALYMLSFRLLISKYKLFPVRPPTHFTKRHAVAPSENKILIQPSNFPEVDPFPEVCNFKQSLPWWRLVCLWRPWKPDFMLATEHRDPQVSHWRKNNRVSFCSRVSGDRHVWQVTYSSV